MGCRYAGIPLRAASSINSSTRSTSPGVLYTCVDNRIHPYPYSPITRVRIRAERERWRWSSADSTPSMENETIAPLSDDPVVARHTFARLRSCRDSLEQQFGCKLTELSMGMSDDFEAAVGEGSTLLRLGSVLFGPRET